MPHQCTECGRAFEDGSKEMLSGCPDCGGTTFQFHPDGVDASETRGGEEPAEPPEPPEPEVDSTVARTVGNAATAVRDLVGGDDSPGYPGDVHDSRPEPTRSEPDRGSPTSNPTVSSGDARPEHSPSGSGSSETAGSIAAEANTREDAAQASARTEVVSPDDLPASSAPVSREQIEPSTREQSGSPTSEQSTRDRPAPVVDETTEEEKEDRPDLDELREQLNEQFESIRVVAPGQYELNLMELYDREEYIIALQEDGKYTIQVPERWGE